jgi:hypothetical protein
VKKPKKESVATAIRLPRETYERLRKKPGGVPDSIKRGLEFVAIEEDADEATRSLAVIVFELAREIELEAGVPWHANGISHRAFRRMLLRAISKWRPADYNDNILEPVRLEPLDRRPLASHPVGDADALGIQLADDVLRTPDRATRDRVRALRKETLQAILKLQQSRGDEGND